MDAQVVTHVDQPLLDTETTGLVQSSIGYIAAGFSDDILTLDRFTADGQYLDSRHIDLGLVIPGLKNYFTNFKEISPGVFIGCGRPTTFSPTVIHGGFVFRYDYQNDQMIWAEHFERFSPYAMEFFDNPVSTIALYGYGDQPSTYDYKQWRFCDPADGSTISYAEYTWSSISNIMQFQISEMHDGSIYASGRNNYSGGGLSKMRLSLTRMDMLGNVDFVRSYLTPISGTGRQYIADIIEGPTGLTLLGRGDYDGTQAHKDIFIIEIDDDGFSQRALMVNGPVHFYGSDIYRYGDGYLVTATAEIGGSRDLVIFYVNDQDELLWVKRTDLPFDQGNVKLSMDLSSLDGDILTIVTGSDYLSSGGNRDMLFIQQDISDFSSECCDVWQDYAGLSLTVLTPFDEAITMDEETSVHAQSSLTTDQSQPLVQTDSYCSGSFTEYATDTVLCEGDSVLWDGEYLSLEGIYTDTITCDSVSTLVIDILPVPEFELGPDITLCQGEPLELTSPILADEYLWSDGGTSPDFSTVESGSIWLEVSESSCTYRDSLMIQFDDEIELDLGPDTSFCEGGSLMLDAPVMADSYLWSDGSSAPGFLTDQAGWVWLEVIAGACTSVDSLLVSVAESIMLDLGADSTLCQGEELLLSSPISADAYLWSTGSVASEITLSNSAEVWLEVSVSGCEQRDSVMVNFDPLINLELGEDVVVCEGESAFLYPEYTGDMIPDFWWSTGTSVNSILADSAGLYWLQAERGACTDTDSLWMTVDTYPAIDSLYLVSVCESGYVPLAALPAQYDYLLQGLPLFQVPITEPGVYEVLVTNGACSSTTQLEVEVTTVPEVELGMDISFCEGEAVELIPSAVYPGFTWQDGTTFSSYLVYSSGVYTYTFENDCGVHGDSIRVEVSSCDTAIYVPNAFSPDGDGVNDIFRAEGQGIGTYELEVYDRWGHLVFQTQRWGQGWNGDVNGGDYYAPDGLYAYRIRYSFDASLPFVNATQTRSIQGHLYLFR